jgi:VWFA-related protein
MKPSLRGLTLLSILLCSLPSLAQAQQSLFFDTVDVRVVNVEVIVTERDGPPVTGLTRQDFEVFEDGNAVEISNFFVVEGREVARQEEVGPTSEREDLLVEPQTRRLNLVVFVDNLNMQPQNRNAVFVELKNYIRERLDPHDRLMIVTMGEGIEVVQPFSNDPEALVATLERLEKDTGSLRRADTEVQILLRNIQRAAISQNPALGGGLTPPDMGWEQAAFNADRLARDASLLAEVRYRNVRSTVSALTHFCNSLAGMPGRKALLYVSDGLPLRPADSLAQAWLNKFEGWVQEQQVTAVRGSLRDMISLSSSSRYDASNEFDRLVDHASASQVVFYPISNARGLRTSSISAEHQGSGTTTGAGAFSADVAALETLSQEGSLLQMAEGTGGVAFSRTTNVEGLLQRVARDFDTFYSLGYAPPHGDDGEIHKIDVRLKGDHRELVVRHLSAHRERDPIEHLADLTLSALQHGMIDNVLEVQLQPDATEPTKGKRHLVRIMVKIPFQNLLLLPDRESHVGQVSLVIVVRDEATGGVSEPQRVDLPIEVPNAQILQIARQAVAYPLQLEVKEGKKRITVGVRDLLARIDSTVDLEIEVPPELQPDPAAAAS